MVVAILNHRTKTVNVVTITDEQLKKFDYDVETYLNEENLINNESDWMSDVKNLIIDNIHIIDTM